MKPAIFCALAALLFVLPLKAERTIRLVYYGAPTDSPLKELFIYGNSSENPAAFIHTKLNRSNFCPPIPIAEQTTTLKLLSEPLKEGQAMPRGATTVRIDKDWQHTLLILFHSNKSKTTLPVGIHKINASPDVFGPGELYWINLSEIAIGGHVGNQKIILRPQQTKVMKCPAGEIECVVRLNYLVRGEEKSRSLIRQMWRIDERTRQVVLILKRPEPKNATYYVLPIRESTPKKEPAEE